MRLVSSGGPVRECDVADCPCHTFAAEKRAREEEAHCPVIRGGEGRPAATALGEASVVAFIVVAGFIVAALVVCGLFVPTP